MSAADVSCECPTLEFFSHAGERRNPRLHEIMGVSRPKELFDAAEQAIVVLTPTDTVARSEGMGQFLLTMNRSGS